MIRVAIVADTHGRLDGRIAELVADCDIVVHGGDIGNATVLARLQPRSGHIHAVRGNNDIPRLWPEHEHALLLAIPFQTRVDLPGGRLVIEHGHRLRAKDRHAQLRRRHPDARAVVYGHSHRLALDLDARPWVLNPGAAGRARTYGGPSCLVLLATGEHWELQPHRFEHPVRPRRRPAQLASNTRKTQGLRMSVWPTYLPPVGNK